MNRLKLFLPIVIFFVMSVFLYFGLGNDPSQLPNVTVGQQLPNFELGTLESNLQETLKDEDLLGEPVLLNVWATWCVSCLAEHPYFLQLSAQGIKIVGINYKDESTAARAWLNKYKNPYTITVYDNTGRLGFDLGVTGAPETYLVGADGQIKYRHVGVVNEKVWLEHFASSFVETHPEQVDPTGEGAGS